MGIFYDYTEPSLYEYLKSACVKFSVLFLIACGDDAGVYYWDDAYVFEESDDDQNVYLLAKDFSELFSVLDFKWRERCGNTYEK